jgi:hypothetical protein
MRKKTSKMTRGMGLADAAQRTNRKKTDTKENARQENRGNSTAICAQAEPVMFERAVRIQ